MPTIWLPTSQPSRLKPERLRTLVGSKNKEPTSSLPFTTPWQIEPFGFSEPSSPESRPTSPSDWEPYDYQREPEGDDWDYWVLRGGRGIGKTDTAAHWIDQQARRQRLRIAIGAPTLNDARRICVEGETGLLAVNPGITFNRSTFELRWPNGSTGILFGAYTPEDIERWRGHNFHLAWLDELASWRYLEECWANLQFGLRIGDHPRILATFTPRPRKFIKRLLENPRTVEARTADGRIPTMDDNPRLPEHVRDALREEYGGTRLGRQELGGELLEDVEGALWQYGWIDAARVKGAPTLTRIMIGVDPAATSADTSDQTGLSVAGEGSDGDYYVLNVSGYRLSPQGWATRTIDLYDQHEADKVIAEINNGGEMVEHTLRQVRRDLPIKVIHASRGKTLRAEPVAALYEQGKVHHVGTFAAAEDQMCSFPVANEHDDLVDALVYALTELAEGRKRKWGAL